MLFVFKVILKIRGSPMTTVRRVKGYHIGLEILNYFPLAYVYLRLESSRKR